MKAPTAEQSLKSHANTEFMWGYHDVIRAIESHTQAHTKELRERVKALEAEIEFERTNRQQVESSLISVTNLHSEQKTKIASYESAIDGLKNVIDSLHKLKSL